MNILFVYPWLTLGGAPNDVLTLAKGLIERGHRVFLFTKSGGIYEEQLKELGIQYVSAPYSRILPRLYHLNPRAVRMFSESLERFSIDIVHAFHPYSYLMALFSAPYKDIPVVFTAVWFLEEWPYPSYPGRVIFVAQEFKDQALRIFRGNLREAMVLPNRVDLEVFKPGVDYTEFARKYELPESGWKIAFMSRVESIKINSLKIALRAAGILSSRGRKLTLAIAGDGPLFGELKSFADRINSTLSEPAIKLLGAVKETPQFLSWADIVLGIGRCAWEGMACGKPTLVVGENGFAGVVAPENFEQLAYYNFAGRNVKEPVSEEVLADKIESIMTDYRRYEELSNYARQCAVEHYDYRAGVSRMLELYQRALSDPPLTVWQRIKLAATNFLFGYLTRAYVALKLKLRLYAGRARPEDYYMP